MPILHQIRPTVRPYCEAEALLMVRLLARLTAGKTIGYRLKAALDSIPSKNVPDESRAGRSRFSKLKKPAPSRPSKPIKIVYQSRMPGLALNGLKSVHRASKK